MAFEARKGHCELSTITDEVPVTLRRLRRVRDRSVISAGRVDPAARVCTSHRWSVEKSMARPRQPERQGPRPDSRICGRLRITNVSMYRASESLVATELLISDDAALCLL